MAPEAPGNIVILDLALAESGVHAKVDRFEPGNGAFWVIWSAMGDIREVHDGAEEGGDSPYVPAGGGVIQVLVPEGARRFQYTAAVQGQDTLVWRDKLAGMGLMLVVVLPAGYVLPSVLPADVEPVPNALKDFDGRLAFFWRLVGQTEDQQVNVSWRMEPLEGRDLGSYVASLTEAAEGHRRETGDIGTHVDPPSNAPPPASTDTLRVKKAPPPDVRHQVVASTSRLLTVTTHWTFVSGILVSLVGVVVLILGGTGVTTFSLFGQSFESTNVGIAAIFIGVVMVILNVRKILSIADRQGRRAA